jgi:hypothetical protein
MVSTRPSRRASSVFVPTPSVAATRIGSAIPAGTATAAPNPPRPPMTRANPWVASTAARIRSTATSPAATSTPARR